MSANNDLEDIIRLLNDDYSGPAHDWSYKDTMNFLREKGLVKFFAKFYRGRVEFSVFSRSEIKSYINKMGEDTPHEIKSLGTSIDTGVRAGHHVVFPEDSSVAYGGGFLNEFRLMLISLQEFFDKLSDGFIDIVELNKHFYDESSFFEFKQTQNPLKPTLSITRGENYSTLNRTIFDRYIYPRLFGGQVQELTKIRKCRNCGLYFLSKRLSATFCSDKCRGAFHHANS